jgi:hypothetical protein
MDSNAPQTPPLKALLRFNLISPRNFGSLEPSKVILSDDELLRYDPSLYELPSPVSAPAFMKPGRDDCGNITKEHIGTMSTVLYAKMNSESLPLPLVDVDHDSGRLTLEDL